MPNGRRQVAIVMGGHLNSYSIALALRAVGWTHDIVFAVERSEESAYARLIPGVATWYLSLAETRDFLSAVDERTAAYAKGFLFLTDERFHSILHEHRDSPSLRKLVYHLGSCHHLEVTLDRFALYKFLGDRRLWAAPLTIDGSEDPWRAFRGPFLLRFKRSWDGLGRLDRVQLVRTRSDLERLLKGYQRRGIAASNWCYQEVLSTAPSDNVSVSGWHGCRVQSYCVTRPLARHPPIKGSALVCELVEGFEDLKAATRTILNDLEYSGPFELEFVKDQTSGTFKVIELNPRFWLQHLLVQQATGYALTRQYLGLSDEVLSTGTGSGRATKKYWINTSHVLAGVLRGKVGLAGYLWDRNTLQMPPVRLALGFLQGKVRRWIGG